MSQSTNSNLQLTEVQLQELFDIASEQSFRHRGAGNVNSLYSTILSQYDRFGVNSMLPNHELVGYTFITRPKLNLTKASLRQDRILSMLDTIDPNSLSFSIRCYLDTNYSNRKEVQDLGNCPFFNPESPFLIPLTNNLVSISGWPDPVIDTETSEGGFYSEDLTMAKGSDRLSRTYNLNLTFRDIQGGYVLSLLYMWIHYIQLVLRGDVTAYPEDIAQRRINYTCSIYRFIMDPSRQFITKWSKATGCFPTSIPIGNVFNFGERESFITSSAQYSVPFIANKVEIWDPIIFRDFNTISKRWSKTLSGFDSVINADQIIDLTPSPSTSNQPFEFSVKPQNNFIGLPFIDVLEGYNRLLWVGNPNDTKDPYATSWNNIKAQLIANTASSNNLPASQPPQSNPAAIYA